MHAINFRGQPKIRESAKVYTIKLKVSTYLNGLLHMVDKKCLCVWRMGLKDNMEQDRMV